MKGIDSFQQKISKFLFHFSSPDENKELYLDLKSSDKKLKDARHWFYGMTEILGTSANQTWINDNYKITRQRIKTKIFIHHALRIAASILLFLSIGTGVYISGLFDTSPEWKKIVLNRGEQKTIQLPDGTTVYLAPSTIFEYPETFYGDTREVKVTGEAFFDVKKNKNIPFIVNTSRTAIEVKGTSFNVMAYEEDNFESTILVEGKVSLTLKDETGNLLEKEYNLRPNQKMFLDKKRNVAEITDIDPSYQPAWMTGRLLFHNETFSKLAKRLERFHDINIEIKNPTISNMKLTGEFENESIFEILDALNILIPFKYNFDHRTNTILISAL